VSPHKRSAWPSHRHYPRMARVNEVLREVLAEEIELVAGSDSRLELVTVTAVSCEPDLRHATVLLASLPGPARAALGEARTRLQAAVARQVRLKRTPLLSFEADPAVAHGERVEEILRSIHAADEQRAPVAGDGGALGPAGSEGTGNGSSAAPGEAGGDGETGPA
jgi:ribosome-binding factor A